MIHEIGYRTLDLFFETLKKIPRPKIIMRFVFRILFNRMDKDG